MTTPTAIQALINAGIPPMQYAKATQITIAIAKQYLGDTTKLLQLNGVKHMDIEVIGGKALIKYISTES